MNRLKRRMRSAILVFVAVVLVILVDHACAQEPALTNAWWTGPGSGPTLHLQYDTPVGGQGWIEDWHDGPATSADNWFTDDSGPDSAEWIITPTSGDYGGWINASDESPMVWPMADGLWKVHDVYGDTYHSFTVASGSGGQIGSFQGLVAEVPEPTPATLVIPVLLILLATWSLPGIVPARSGWVLSGR